MNKNVLHDMIFFKTTFIIVYPQNVHIYLQHINIFIQNLVVKSLNIHALQPWYLCRLQCLVRFLDIIFTFWWWKCKFQNSNYCNAVIWLDIFSHTAENQSNAAEVKLPWGMSSMFCWGKKKDRFNYFIGIFWP